MYGVNPAQIVGALARKAERQRAVGRSPKDRVVCLKKLQPNGTTSYYVYIRTADWNTFELFWEDETSEWKDSRAEGCSNAVCFTIPTRSGSSSPRTSCQLRSPTSTAADRRIVTVVYTASNGRGRVSGHLTLAALQAPPPSTAPVCGAACSVGSVVYSSFDDTVFP